MAKSLIGLTIAERNVDASDTEYINIGVVVKDDERTCPMFYFVEFMDSIFGSYGDTWFSVDEILGMHEFYKELEKEAKCHFTQEI